MENGESEKMRKTSPKHATPGTWNLELYIWNSPDPSIDISIRKN